MSKTYKVIFTSNLLPGVSQNIAIDNISHTLNLSKERSKELLSREKAIVLKKNISYEVANKYKEELTKAGLQIKILQDAEAQFGKVHSSQKEDNISENSYKSKYCGENEINCGEIIGKLTRHLIVQNKCVSFDDISFIKAWVINYIFAIGIAIALGSIIGVVVGIISAVVRIDKNISQILTTIFCILGGLFSSYHFYKWSITKYIIPQLQIKTNRNISETANIYLKNED